MADKLSFEEACKLSHTIASSDNFKTLGIPETMKKWREALEEAGWTVDQIVDESEKRSREWVKSYHAS